MANIHQPVPTILSMALVNNTSKQYNDKGLAMGEPAMTARQQEIVHEIEKMVEGGHQKEITSFFSSWAVVPNRIGDWQIRTNHRRVDNAVVGRTVIALPLTVRARMIFEKGCIATLLRNGFTAEDAKRYYKYAWKRQYVWVETVLIAVSEMIAAFRTTDVPRSYLETGDPRRLADAVNVPKNPFMVAHNHFIVAAEMACLVIEARNREENQSTH